MIADRLSMPEFLLLSAGTAYLAGSIPFGLLLGFSRGIDIRKSGSGNIGASNAGRVLGRRFFWYAFFLDVFKGFIPVLSCDLLANAWRMPTWIPLIAAAAAVFGHVFPIFLKFKGGKGIATTFGALLGVWPVLTLATLGGLAIFALVLLLYRYISLASIIGSMALTPLAALVGRSRQVTSLGLPRQTWQSLAPLLLLTAAITILIIIRHRGNLARLMAGTEPKVGTRTVPKP